jgi:hypothetical protein
MTIRRKAYRLFLLVGGMNLFQNDCGELHESPKNWQNIPIMHLFYADGANNNNKI